MRTLKQQIILNSFHDFGKTANRFLVARLKPIIEEDYFQKCVARSNVLLKTELRPFFKIVARQTWDPLNTAATVNYILLSKLFGYRESAITEAFEKGLEKVIIDWDESNRSLPMRSGYDAKEDKEKNLSKKYSYKTHTGNIVSAAIQQLKAKDSRYPFERYEENRNYNGQEFQEALARQTRYLESCSKTTDEVKEILQNLFV